MLLAVITALAVFTGPCGGMSATKSLAVCNLSGSSISFGNQAVGTTSSAHSVKLSNTGSAALGITGITITGTNGNNFAQSNNCGRSLAAGASCTISATFKPSATGTRSGTLSIANNSSVSSQKVGLSGMGGTPAATFSAGSLPFGGQPVGAKSAVKAVTLTNSGNAALTISSLAIAGANAGDFAQSNNCGSSVAVGAGCTVNVTFTPSASGSRTASLSVADNASGSPQALSLSGTGAAAAVSLSTSNLSLGNQALGTTSAAGSVTLTNTGGVALSVTSVTIGGTNAGDFTQTNNCGSSVGAGSSCTISVTFKPTVASAENASVSIADSASGSPQAVSLAGTGTAPSVSLSSSSLSFGNQSVGAASAAQTVTLSNKGNGTLYITSAGVTGTNAADFTETNTCGSSVAAGASCTISVTFKPTAASAETATVSVADSASGSPQVVSLAGTGTAPSVSLSSSSLSFGNQSVGAASAAQTVTLSNQGNGTLNITSAGVTGTNAADFTETNTCGSSVAAGASCTISVTFKPTVASAENASVSIADSASGSPQAVSLAGTGTAPSVSLSSSSLSFGNQAVGAASAAQTVTLSNQGNGTLNITSAGVTGANAADFTETNTCGSSIAAGASCTISVTFKPTVASAETATVSVADSASGSPQAVSLAGTGTAPSVSLSSSSLSFGNQAVGAASAAQTVTLSNQGNGTLNITSAGVTGANAADFTETNTCGSSIAAGASCTISVTFKPTVASAENASVSIADSASGSPQAISLSGTGSSSGASASASFVQAASTVSFVSPSSLSLSFPANTLAGDLLLVAFDYNINVVPSSVSDTQGNEFSQVGNQLISPGGAYTQVYYAKNVKGGADTVTVTLPSNSSYLELYLSEYSGIDTTNPIDGQAGATGSTGAVSSGSVTTTVAGDMIYGYCIGDAACTIPSGFTARSILDGNLIEDMVAGSAGSYASTGTATEGWTMQMVALKSAQSAVVQSPVISSATTTSGTAGSAFSYQIIATNTPASYAATGLPSGLSVDTATGLVSGTPAATGTSTVTLSATNAGGTGKATLTLTIAAAIPAAFVQAVASASSGSSNSLSLAFPANTAAGDLLLVAFDYNINVVPSSVSDTQGNVFSQVGNQLISPGGAHTQVYYAKNTKGGADTVTVTLPSNYSYLELYLSEYSGIDATNPIDGQAGASGNAGAVSSGSVTTTVAGDMIYGYCIGDAACTVASGFTPRSTLNGNLVEDDLASSAGSYAATGTANQGWAMQMVALKPASTTTEGTAPAVSFSTPSLAFPSQNVGSTSSAQSVTLTNSGDAALMMSGISVTGVNPSDFAETNNCGSSVAAGGSCTISVIFTPAGSGSFSASVSLADNASGSPQSVSLSGTGTSSGGGGGTGSAPAVSLSTSTLSFGTQPISMGTSAQTFTLTNSGNATLSITNLAITGTNAGDFSEVADTCGSSVAAGGNCTVSVSFTPSLASSETASVTISDNAAGGQQGVTLTGTGSHDVVLSWSASSSSGVSGYYVYRGTSSGGESATPLNSTPINGTTFADQNVSAGTTYYYKVAAEGPDGVQSAESSETQTTVP